MAARDRYSYSIKCPGCGQDGECHVSENDYPFMNSLDRKIESIAGDFSFFEHRDSDVKVTCNKCHTHFKA